METKVKCPVCGAEFEIAEHQHVVNNSTVIGADSGLGTVYLPLKKKGKMSAEEKISALKAAGISGEFFSIKSENSEFVGKMDNGTITIVDESDPAVRQILRGTVGNSHLFRRFVMSQMFDLLTAKSWHGYRELNFTEALNRKGGEYQWKMLYNELRQQASLEKHGDFENLEPRKLYFSRELVLQMMNDYLKDLKKKVEGLKIRKCKGKPYVRIYKIGDIFCSEIDKELYKPVLDLMSKVRLTSNVQELCEVYAEFYKIHKKYECNDKMYKQFVDAYKAVGAYFTMKNMIMFHGCKYMYNSSEKSSLDALNDTMKMDTDNGWIMLGKLKEFIKYNNFSIEEKKNEWRKQYEMKRKNRK